MTTWTIRCRPRRARNAGCRTAAARGTVDRRPGGVDRGAWSVDRERFTVNGSLVEAGGAAGFLELGEGVEDFLARDLALVFALRVAVLVDGLLQRPLLRQRQCGFRDQVLSGEAGVRLRQLRRVHVEKFLMGHAAVGHRPDRKSTRL